jgi:hypothetical protein
MKHLTTTIDPSYHRKASNSFPRRNMGALRTSHAHAGSEVALVFRRIQTGHAHVLSDTPLHRDVLLQSPPHDTLAALSAEVQNSFRSQWLSEYGTLEDKVKVFSDKHIAVDRRYLPQGRKLRDMVCLSELDDRRGYFPYRRQLLESSGGAIVAVAVWEIQAIRSGGEWSLAGQDLRHTYGSSLSDSAAPTATATGASSDAQSQGSESRCVAIGTAAAPTEATGSPLQHLHALLSYSLLENARILFRRASFALLFYMRKLLQFLASSVPFRRSSHHIISDMI